MGRGWISPRGRGCPARWAGDKGDTGMGPGLHGGGGQAVARNLQLGLGALGLRSRGAQLRGGVAR